MTGAELSSSHRYSPSSIEHFARVVSPRGWKDVRIPMLTVCFDASGKTPTTTTKRKKDKGRQRDSQVMAVCGFASQAGMWAEFDDKWNSVLAAFDVPHFHAGDFASCNGPFKCGWSGQEQKRRDFQWALIDVIKTCGLRKFGSLLWIQDQQKGRKALDISDDDLTASPYVLCARAAVDDFNAFAIGEGQYENVEYIFEKGDEEDKLRKHFAKHKYHDPVFRWSKPVEQKGIVRKPFIGLQPAGWIVWEYYMNFLRWFDEKNAYRVVPQDRWALTVFDDHRSIPGEVKILYKSSPLLHWLSNRRNSFVGMARSVAESTARIESARKGAIIDKNETSPGNDRRAASVRALQASRQGGSVTSESWALSAVYPEQNL